MTRRQTDLTRLAQALALLTWAGFFHYLWLGDRALRYVGPKTQWVVPFGAIALTIAGLLALRSVRTSGPVRRPGLRESASLVGLLAPVLCALMVPSPTLGALAVRNKGNADAAIAAAARNAPDAGEPISVFDIAVASRSLEYANQRGITDGTRVSVEGLVSSGSVDGVGRFQLSRFRSNCCAADAIPYTITVAPTESAPFPSFVSDDWLRVKGTLKREGEEFVLVAASAEKIRAPANPYV